MLLNDSDQSLLKTWVVDRLEKTKPEGEEGLDIEVLSDYVILLLMHDGPEAEVRRLLEEEILNFLPENIVIGFARDLFHAINNRSFKPGAPTPPRSPPKATLPAKPRPPQPAGTKNHPPNAPSGPKKRTFDESSDGSGYDPKQPLLPTGRNISQPHRGGRGGKWKIQNGARGTEAPAPHLYQPPYPGSMGVRSGNGVWPQGRDGLFSGNSGSFPSMASMGEQDSTKRRRKACRDWEQKGFCERGLSCKFEHRFEMLPGMSLMPPFSDGFDMTQVPMMFPEPSQEQMQQFARIMRENESVQATLNSQASYQKQKQKQHKGKSPFSGDGPVLDRTKSTIVVENIPEEHFAEDQVRDFFSHFGNIVEVTMHAYKRLAVVKFETWDAANTAYRSPKVIFDNRFVKVFWYKDGADVSGPRDSANGKAANGNQQGASRGTPTSELEEGEVGDGELTFDMEEFTRKQEEAQKQHDDKKQKRLDLDRRREEIEKRQKELFVRQREEQKKLYAKMAGSDSPGTASIATEAGSTTNAAALRAQLAALEEEAMALGIDPDAEDAQTDSWSPWYARGRGEFRGGYRGRGQASRGFRGGYGSRGGRGGGAAAYAAYSLDNRPKKVAVSGLDFTMPEKDEVLRQYLLGIGEFTDITTTAASAQITFRDRKTAEKFFYSLSGKELPNLEGTLELAWVNDSATVTKPASLRGFGGVENDDRNGDAAKDADIDDKKGRMDVDEQFDFHADSSSRDNAQMDYDVGDWDIE